MDNSNDLFLNFDLQNVEKPCVYVILEDEYCPVCDELLLINGRCRTCPECGWSSCDI